MISGERAALEKFKFVTVRVSKYLKKSE